MNTRVHSFNEMSLAARGALTRAGYRHIKDLDGVPDEVLLKIKWVGVNTLEHIRTRLERWRIEGSPTASLPDVDEPAGLDLPGPSADGADAGGLVIPPSWRVSDHRPPVPPFAFDPRYVLACDLLKAFVGTDGYKVSKDFAQKAVEVSFALHEEYHQQIAKVEACT